MLAWPAHLNRGNEIRSYTSMAKPCPSAVEGKHKPAHQIPRQLHRRPDKRQTAVSLPISHRGKKAHRAQRSVKEALASSRSKKGSREEPATVSIAASTLPGRLLALGVAPGERLLLDPAPSPQPWQHYLAATSQSKHHSAGHVRWTFHQSGLCCWALRQPQHHPAGHLRWTCHKSPASNAGRACTTSAASASLSRPRALDIPPVRALLLGPSAASASPSRPLALDMPQVPSLKCWTSLHHQRSLSITQQATCSGPSTSQGSAAGPWNSCSSLSITQQATCAGHATSPASNAGPCTTVTASASPSRPSALEVPSVTPVLLDPGQPS